MSPDANTSEAGDARAKAYAQAVAALQAINPASVPVAQFTDPCAIARVVQQVRDAVPPSEPTASPERMLRSRVSNMQGAVAALVDKAKRKGIPVELPVIDDGDLGSRLQKLNAAYDEIERKVAYYDRTTPERRAIDGLAVRLDRVEKRVDAIAAALGALNKLLPLLLPAEVKDARAANGE
jgi:hypothetical protein